jgi:hypothetical protein
MKYTTTCEMKIPYNTNEILKQKICINCNQYNDNFNVVEVIDTKENIEKYGKLYAYCCVYCNKLISIIT